MVLLVSSHGDVIYDVDTRLFYSLQKSRWAGWNKVLLKAQNIDTP